MYSANGDNEDDESDPAEDNPLETNLEETAAETNINGDAVNRTENQDGSTGNLVGSTESLIGSEESLTGSAENLDQPADHMVIEMPYEREGRALALMAGTLSQQLERIGQSGFMPPQASLFANSSNGLN